WQRNAPLVSCWSGSPTFFYKSTSFRCERFFSGCGSNRNSFETQEGCEALLTLLGR
uniref:BPTI/Kunitz inhibitor domain-containing protein n=1 Tax=Seriola dumerili TaxID=41447 RepID=A0A3B4TTB2_SERDU